MKSLCLSSETGPFEESRLAIYITVIWLFIESGADIEARDENDDLLFSLKIREYLATIRRLWKPISTSVRRIDFNYAEVCRLLLESGANIQARNKDKETPWSLAVAANSEVSHQLLRFCVKDDMMLDHLQRKYCVA
ncbi:hypothetical protein F4820DRAFT_413522, partial [Hypoxylon rubiginosum]